MTASRAALEPAGAAPALTVVVIGQPRPKGSLRHVGHGRMIEQVEGSKPWREAVKAAALTALAVDHPGPYPFGTGPVRVDITYTVSKPASAPKRRRTWPVTRSSFDVDKVARNCLDALVDAAVLRDDAQVVFLLIRKTYVGEDPDALDRPGAIIRIRPINERPSA